MATVTFQVLDGVDRGKIYRELPTPVMIGREEGNAVQLNDERVSRFHAKVQEDSDQFIITDLESTNGTRVNGEHVTFAILRVGDRVCVGRSTLLFGRPEDIAAVFGHRGETPGENDDSHTVAMGKTHAANERNSPTSQPSSSDLSYNVSSPSNAVQPPAELLGSRSGPRTAPPLPGRLAPGQAAQLGELLLYLHRPLASVAEIGRRDPADDSVHVPAHLWQDVMKVAVELARYYRALGHPE
jgi:predicted component of type VI protein secretion system